MARLATAALVVVAGCQTVETTRGGAVGVEREQRMMVSAQQVDAAAREQYAAVLKESAQKGILEHDSPRAQRVRCRRARRAMNACSWTSPSVRCTGFRPGLAGSIGDLPPVVKHQRWEPCAAPSRPVARRMLLHRGGCAYAAAQAGTRA